MQSRGRSPESRKEFLVFLSYGDASNEEGNINVPVLAGLTPHLEMMSLKHNVLRIHSYILLICSM